MKKIDLDFEQSPNSVEAIYNFEKSLDCKLSQDFVDFLVLNNGGFPKQCIFPVKDEDIGYIVQFFYALNTQRSDYSIEKFISTLHKNFMSNHFLPFANDPGGWMYVLSLREKDYNHVYFYRPDEPEDDCLTLLATSFNEFIDKLQEPITSV